MLYALQTVPGLGMLAWREAEQALSDGAGAHPPRLAGIRAAPGRDDIVLIDYQAVQNLCSVYAPSKMSS